MLAGKKPRGGIFAAPWLEAKKTISGGKLNIIHKSADKCYSLSGKIPK